MKLNNEEIKDIKKQIQELIKQNFKNIGEDGYIIINRKGVKLSSLKSCKNKEYNSLSIMYSAYILNLLDNYKNLTKNEKETIKKHSKILELIVGGII